ncbi:MAG: hypothetical protein NUV61_03100 [Candidatus Azambacteria bacterium]|nr:hypothetical protein [Candidatus Azambacteria bacterium]
MTEWLRSIIEEAKGINLEKFRPMDEVGPGDYVIGEASDPCKQLYALANKYNRLAAEKRGEASTTPFIESSSKQYCMEEARKMEQKAKAVMVVFQASVRHAHNLWDEIIGLRRGWVIVRIDILGVPNRANIFFDD